MGAPGPLTYKHEALEPLIDDQEPPNPLTDNQGDMGPLTDDQGPRAGGPAIQIFNNIYVKPVKNLKVLC